MTKKRKFGWQKATALVPLVLLSGAWTTSLTTTATAANTEVTAPTLPDGSKVPTQAIKAPASVSSPGEVAPGIPVGSEQQVINSASTNGIPSAALAAYQRDAQIINTAAPNCNLSWTLIGAIGRVESNHGRAQGNVLNAEGVATPGIYGPELNGKNGTQRIYDTDAGQYDHDKTFDRAVGPMQFIPSTWSVVGVDGDGDGVRNPQDINDAALATAVYLCSGGEDLSTLKGQQTAVYRYNHSSSYVALVLSIAQAYAAGDYSAVPTSTAGTTVFTPFFGDSVITKGTTGKKAPKSKPSKSSSKSTSSSQPPSGSSTSPGVGGGTAPNPGTVSGKVNDTTKKVKDTVKNTVTPLEKATAYCKDNLTSSQLDALGGLQACTSAYLDGGAQAVQNLLSGLLGTVGGLLGN